LEGRVIAEFKVVDYGGVRVLQLRLKAEASKRIEPNQLIVRL
jgi:hypothetical protein